MDPDPHWPNMVEPDPDTISSDPHPWVEPNKSLKFQTFLYPNYFENTLPAGTTETRFCKTLPSSSKTLIINTDELNCCLSKKA